MNKAQMLAMHIKDATVDIETDRVRMTRALILAQAASMKVKLDTSKCLEEQLKDAQEDFEDLADAVNEFTVVNCKLACSLFSSILEARRQIALGTPDNALMMAVLKSDTVSQALPEDGVAALGAYLDTSAFLEDQKTILSSLQSFDPAPIEEDDDGEEEDDDDD